MTTRPKRKRTQIPALLRAATIPMLYHHYCASCKREVGTSSHLEGADMPIVCAACKRAMREVAAA